MSDYATISTGDAYVGPVPAAAESRVSAVSWAAIAAGAFANLAISAVLLMVVAGLGLTEISPHPSSGVSATTFVVTTGIAAIVVQWIAAAMGGFLTGRLRSKWTGIHTHEIFFRDTVHGFMSWALATVVSGFLLASSASSMLGTSVEAAATLGSGATQGAAARTTPGIADQDLDKLFRTVSANAAPVAPETWRDASRLLASGATNGSVAPDDKAYLAQIISTRAGISIDEANKRLDDEMTREKAAEAKAAQIADSARKGAAQFALFTALAMIVGAFIASVAGAYGGNIRDLHRAI